MSPALSVENDAVHGVITYDLLVDGQAISASDSVLSISVVKEVNRIPTARLVLRDGDVATGKFEVSDGKSFEPGKEIEIKIGRDRNNITVFKGLIIKQHIRIQEDGTANLMVECKDKAVRMTIGRHNHYYEERKDSEVIEEVIARSGLGKDVEATKLKHKELVQFHSTDWDFILSRAEVNGKVVTVDDGKVIVKEPKTSGSPTGTARFGDNLLEFEAEMDARTQWKAVEAKAWDYKTQALFEQTSNSAKVTEPGNIKGSKLADIVAPDKFELRHSGQVLEAELKDWTDAAMLRSRLAKICGRARFFGSADIKPGHLLTLENVGERFNGNVYVSAVRHDVGEGDWDTNIQFGLKPGWFNRTPEIIDVPAAGLLPAVNGLQIGKVVQLEEDPDGEDRILVRLPIVNNSAPGVWARVATLDAGENRGSFFRPEIDDEVVVGFLNDDPRDPIVLGMLNSSAKPAPIQAQDVNHEKGFVTRSEMRIHFHDETKTITIDTPAGNSIVLDEDSTSIVITDQNDNTIKMEPDGITMDSPKDITITAGGKIDIKATGDMTLEAMKIAATAQTALEATGATTKLAAQGINEIAGSLIKIN